MTTRYFQLASGTFAVWDSMMSDQAPKAGSTLIVEYDEHLYPVIHDQLNASTKTAVWNAVLRTLTIGNVVVLDGAWIDARATETLTDEHLKSAASVAIAQGKDYLRKQLLNASPNTQTIVTALSTAINGNPYLLQMFTNQRDLMIAAFAWGTVDTGTAIGRTRYILVAEQVIALLT